MSASSSTTFDIKSLYSEAIRDMEVYIMFRIAKKVAELTPGLTEKGRAPIKLSIGAPVVDPPKVLLEELKKAIDTPGLHGYSTPKGEAFFLEAVQKRMKDRFGVDVTPKTQVMSLIGSKEGLANMFRALITYTRNPAEQDVIIIPDPGYASYMDSIEIAGGRFYSMRLTPENDYKPDFEVTLRDMQQEGIDPKRVKALVMCYPHAPIGATCGLDYYDKAVAFCREHQILLISDLAYADVYFPGEEPPHSVLEVPGAMDVAIEFHSLSKPYSTTGWRMGFAVGNPDAIEALERVKGTMDSGMFKCVQKAAAFVMNSSECFDFAMAQNRVYQENQAIMLKGFEELGWPIQELSVPKATFYLWLPIPKWATSAEAFCDALLETSGIVTVPGTAFGVHGEGFFRMSLVDTQEKLHEAIARMKEDGFSFTK
jgi:LL-diaminopimelate aminotransferase